MPYDLGMAAILTDDSAAPGASRCPACGTAFGCGIASPDGCWCARLPALDAPPMPGAGCLCPACLSGAIARARPAAQEVAATRPAAHGLGPTRACAHEGGDPPAGDGHG